MKVDSGIAPPSFAPVVITIQTEEEFKELLITLQSGDGSIALYHAVAGIADKRGITHP